MSQLFDKQAFPDRPWNGRGYGRIRLDENLANELNVILTDEFDRRMKDYIAAKERGGDFMSEKYSLKRVSQLRKRVWNLMVDQGWTNQE